MGLGELGYGLSEVGDEPPAEGEGDGEPPADGGGVGF